MDVQVIISAEEERSLEDSDYEEEVAESTSAEEESPNGISDPQQRAKAKKFVDLGISKKEALFDDNIMPYLHYSDDIKEKGMKRALKAIAKCWRSYKSTLVSDFMLKDKSPYERLKHLKKEDYEAFVKIKRTEEFLSARNRYRELCERNKHNHHLGTDMMHLDDELHPEQHAEQQKDDKQAEQENGDKQAEQQQLHQAVPDLDLGSISQLSEPTSCSLLGTVGGYQVEVVRGECHLQPPGYLCCFYAAHDLLFIVLAASKMQNPEEFIKLTTEPLEEWVLAGHREQITNFIVNDILDPKEEFHLPLGDTVAYHLSVLKDMFPHGMNVLSLFSGIGGAEVALHKLGIHMKNVVSVENSKANRAVLRTYPCNNLAGSNRYHHNGLEGEHSSLFYHYVWILEEVKSAMLRRSSNVQGIGMNALLRLTLPQAVDIKGKDDNILEVTDDEDSNAVSYDLPSYY
ncbi:hypothetical protein PR202_ga16125 [Eleusine coracana subsp. coracana]|uniref:Uncharacterized protein n=1 Tax=Eleusine coracana subsp. coracana TaxID=191504 RepID=A0AAV5CM10_ELECO|nr:hypothetical protein PR202_ga16125 [Eleusine coracana subsp. coracana]